MLSNSIRALQWRNCLGRLRGYKDPILFRMIVMPLEKTLTCCDSMEGRDGQRDIFCKKTVSSVKSLLCDTLQIFITSCMHVKAKRFEVCVLFVTPMYEEKNYVNIYQIHLIVEEIGSMSPLVQTHGLSYTSSMKYNFPISEVVLNCHKSFFNPTAVAQAASNVLPPFSPASVLHSDSSSC